MPIQFMYLKEPQRREGADMDTREETVFRRPDEAALRRLLERNRLSSAGLILRLAWNMGLSATEMHQLKWSDISLEEGIIFLPDRRIPLDEDTRRCLEARRGRNFSRRSEFVVLSERRRVHMHRVNISVTAHDALETEEALRSTSLKDLREDFVIRRLQQYGCDDAARVSGLTPATLKARYGQYFPPEGAQSPQGDKDVETKLREAIRREGATPEGVAIRMSWQLGLQGKEIISLRWEQVDLQERCIHLPKRTVFFDAELESLLRQIRLQRPPDAAPYVLLTPRAKKPFNESRLYVSVRTALIRSGVSGLSLGDLTRSRKQAEVHEPVVACAAERGSVTRAEVEEAFQYTSAEAYAILKRLTEQKKLVRVGAKYYPAGSVVEPEKQYDAVCAYLRENGLAYRKDLADLLGVNVKTCGWILHGFVEAGLLRMEKQKYMLPEEAADNIAKV